MEALIFIATILAWIIFITTVLGIIFTAIFFWKFRKTFLDIWGNVQAERKNLK